MSVSLSSKSRDDYEFIIPPWEYRGADFDPRPDAVVEVVSSFRREMMLKVKQNYLFFREVADYPDRTYAVFQPLAKTAKEAEALKAKPELLCQIFQEARAKGNLAKMHWMSRELNPYTNAKTTVVGLLCADGRGVLKEFWDEEGIPIQLASSKSDEKIWHHDAGSMNMLMEEAWSEEIQVLMAKREVPEEILQGGPLRWIRGSEDDLRKVVTWFMQGTLRLSETEKTRYRFEAASPVNPQGRLRIYGFYTKSNQLTANQQSLIDLFLQENFATGWKWYASDKSKYSNFNVRGWCEVESYYWQDDIASPTAHERLEAKLNLRNWLRGKLPEAEIQRLLS